MTPGPDLALPPDSRSAAKDREGIDDRVRLDRDLVVHEGRCAVHDRHAGLHQAAIRALIHDARRLLEVAQVVHAHKIRPTRHRESRGSQPHCRRRGHHVGEIVLPFRRMRLQRRQVVTPEARVEYTKAATGWKIKQVGLLSLTKTK